MDSNAVSLAALGVLATAVGLVAWVVKYALTRLGKDLQEHTKAAVKQTASNEELVRAVKSFDTYLRERNGRDNEVHKQLLAGFDKVPTSVQTIADNSVAQIGQMIQNVEVQRVGTQVIKEGIKQQ